MSRQICNSIDNMAFITSGYFDYHALSYAATGFVFGVIAGIAGCSMI